MQTAEYAGTTGVFCDYQSVIGNNAANAVNPQGQPQRCGSPQRLSRLNSGGSLNTPKHQSLIVGATIGDSWIGKNGGASKAYVLWFQHSDDQLSYLEWKRDRFSALGFEVSKIYDVSKDGFYAHRFNASLGDIAQYWRHQFYPNGNKTVSRHLLNMLDSEGLAIWFMDDGSRTYHKQGGTAEICLHTEAYTLPEHEIIRSYLRTVWGLSTGQRHANKRGKTYYYVSLLSETKKRFIDIIKPHACPAMLWKFEFESRRSKAHLGNEMVV